MRWRRFAQLLALHDGLGQSHLLRPFGGGGLARVIAEAVRAGVRSQDIAAALGISRSTLWRHYADGLRKHDKSQELPRGPDPISSTARAQRAATARNRQSRRYSSGVDRQLI